MRRDGDEKRSEAQWVLEIARERRAQAQVFIDQGAARFEARLGSGDGEAISLRKGIGVTGSHRRHRELRRTVRHISCCLSLRPEMLRYLLEEQRRPRPPLHCDRHPRRRARCRGRRLPASSAHIRAWTASLGRKKERLAAQVRALEQEARERERESAQIQDEQGIERQRAGAHVVQEQEGSASDKARAYAREGELLQHVSSLTLKHNQETKATREHAAGLERQLGELHQQLEQTRAREVETMKECEMKRETLQAQVGEMEHARLDGNKRRREKKKRVLLRLSRLEVAVAFDWFVTHCLASKVPAP